IRDSWLVTSWLGTRRSSSACPALSYASRITHHVSGLLLRHDQAHVSGVVEDPSAVRARDDFLVALAGYDHLALEFHVAPAADAVRDAHHHILAFAFTEPFVARQDAFIHRRRELIAV